MKSSERLRASCCYFILIMGMLIWPVQVVAHGWKAPTEASQKTNPIPSNAASIQHGEEIYRGRCAGCHGIRAGGNGKIVKNLDPKPANLVKRLRNHSEGDFFWKISNGRGAMPGFKAQLPEEQIWKVIIFIRSLSGM